MNSLSKTYVIFLALWGMASVGVLLIQLLE